MCTCAGRVGAAGGGGGTQVFLAALLPGHGRQPLGAAPGGLQPAGEGQYKASTLCGPEAEKIQSLVRGGKKAEYWSSYRNHYTYLFYHYFLTVIIITVIVFLIINVVTVTVVRQKLPESVLELVRRSLHLQVHVQGSSHLRLATFRNMGATIPTLNATFLDRLVCILTRPSHHLSQVRLNKTKFTPAVGEMVSRFLCIR